MPHIQIPINLIQVILECPVMAKQINISIAHITRNKSGHATPWMYIPPVGKGLIVNMPCEFHGNRLVSLLTCQIHIHYARKYI